MTWPEAATYMTGIVVIGIVLVVALFGKFFRD